MARPRSIEQVRTGYFALTAANTLASQYYLNYLFFLLQDRFGFGNRDNLLVSALYGFIYIFSAWQCGKFAERRGYAMSIQLGFGLLALCMFASGVFDVAGTGGAAAHLWVLAVYSVVLLLTWPALEAVTTAFAPASRLPHLVGVYNCTWSSAAAVAYFTGGALYEWLGAVAVFWIPGGLFLLQFIVARSLGAQEPSHSPAVAAGGPPLVHPEPIAFAQSVPPQTFLTLAWVASPFSYVAIYTILPIIPGLALRLGLSATQTGIVCSVWMFARLLTFAGFWRWHGWHYRFRWLLSAQALLIVSFAAILVAPNLLILVVAQVAFGVAVGVIYYSSLFYSMDVGEASKAEHGGIHEAVIGLGSFAGPAVGALALWLAPGRPGAGVIAVSGLLAAGVGILVTIWHRAKKRRPSDGSVERATGKNAF